MSYQLVSSQEILDFWWQSSDLSASSQIWICWCSHSWEMPRSCPSSQQATVLHNKSPGARAAQWCCPPKLFLPLWTQITQQGFCYFHVRYLPLAPCIHLLRLLSRATAWLHSPHANSWGVLSLCLDWRTSHTTFLDLFTCFRKSPPLFSIFVLPFQRMEALV